MNKNESGFTLIELLIAVSIILLLSMFVFINLRGQSARANDNRRKTDLYTLRKAFEEYFNDTSTYPDPSILSTCGSTELAPYIAKIPCDPTGKTMYGYFPSYTGGYRICAKLADTTDPAIIAMNCDGSLGCGVGGGYNYCLTSGVTASAVGTEDEITGGEIVGGGGTPSPTTTGGGGGVTPTPSYNTIYSWACTYGGACNTMNPLPYERGCPIAWEFGCPEGACDIVANRCPYY